nr:MULTISPECIES: PhzF family phenazine biosynthesis protein [Lactococcus]
MKTAFPRAIIQEVYTTQENDHLVLVLDSETAVKDAKPQIAIIKSLAPHAVTITAKSTDVGFVLRYFAPNGGVDEAPVTGSSHTRLTPLWGEKLEKTKLIAKQLSNRGGLIACGIEGERVKISGQTVLEKENIVIHNYDI